MIRRLEFVFLAIAIDNRHFKQTQLYPLNYHWRNFFTVGDGNIFHSLGWEDMGLGSGIIQFASLSFKLPAIT
jgi:hypothetical protein